MKNVPVVSILIIKILSSLVPNIHVRELISGSVLGDFRPTETWEELSDVRVVLGKSEFVATVESFDASAEIRILINHTFNLKPHPYLWTLGS